MLSNSCRVCLKQNTKLTSLYSTDEYEQTPREMLLKLTGIRLEHEEELSEVPKQICRNCICELTLAYQFRQKALESQSIIELFCKELMKDTKDTKVKKTNNEIIVIKSEKNDTAQENTNAHDEVELLDVSFAEGCEISNNLESCAINSETTKRSKCTLSKKKLKTASESNQLKCLAQPNSRLLSKRGRKPKSPGEKETAFICDICGNKFSKRSRLTEHRHRHETELRYSCEICGERFLMREMLRRHMFQHVGEKPYKCSFCSRTFFYESVKKSHEAVHAGYKPYVCNQCDKAFAYPHALTKHKLIHADIKLYNCHYCNKDFRLQHHMKQHEQTALHRNALLAAEKLIKNKTNQ